MARDKATAAINNITELADAYTSTHEPTCNSYADELIDDVQYQIMKIAVEQELK